MTKQPKTVEEAQHLLKEAIANSPYSVASLTWKLFGNRRGKDFLRHYIRNRKKKIGGAYETAAVERELGFEPGTFAIAVDEPDEAHLSGDNDELVLIEEAMKLAARLADPRHGFSDGHFRLAAELFQEVFVSKRFSAKDIDSRRLKLELAIRRACQRKTP